MQHACLKVFRAKGCLLSKPYLLTTIRNLFYDQCRRDGILKSSHLPDEALIDPQPSPARLVDGKMDMASLMATLSRDEREVLYLNCVENYTANEIAAITGKPRGTILGQLSRAKQKLRQQKDPSSYSEGVV